MAVIRQYSVRKCVTFGRYDYDLLPGRIIRKMRDGENSKQYGNKNNKRIGDAQQFL